MTIFVRDGVDGEEQVDLTENRKTPCSPAVYSICYFLDVELYTILNSDFSFVLWMLPSMNSLYLIQPASNTYATLISAAVVLQLKHASFLFFPKQFMIWHNCRQKVLEPQHVKCSITHILVSQHCLLSCVYL